MDEVAITNPELHYNSCLAVIKAKGWNVRFSKWSWQAWKYDNGKPLAVLARTPLELLGGIALYEARGENFRETPEERKEKLAERLIVGAIDEALSRKGRVKVIRPLPWVCPHCRERTANRMEAVKEVSSDKLQLRVMCSCGNAILCSDAEGDFEILTHQNDFYILRYCGLGHEHEPLLDGRNFNAENKPAG